MSLPILHPRVALLSALLLCPAFRLTGAEALPKGSVLGDTFTLQAGKREAGSSLIGQLSEIGGKEWTGFGKPILTADGSVSVADANGAMGLLELPAPDDPIDLSGDLKAGSAGFAALALLPDKSPGDFWKTAAAWVLLMNNGDYQIFAHGNATLLKQGAGTDYAFRKGELNHVELLCDPSSKTINVRLNGTTVLPTTEVPDLPPLVCAAFRFNDSSPAFEPLLDNFAVSPALPALHLTSVSPRQFYVQPDQNATLSWRHSPKATGSLTEVIVRNYAGQEFCRLPVTSPVAGSRQVAVKLPQGYYSLFFPETGQEFGLVVCPAFTQQPDHFFGIDAALSQLVPFVQREDLIDILPRLGIIAARERLSWAPIEPARETFDWETAAKIDATRQIYARAGVGVLEMCIGTPGWLAKDQEQIYPRDLAATASSWAVIGQRWQGDWQGLEIWNEPDLASGGNEPADQYLPTLKAVRYGLRSHSISTSIVGGVFAYFNKDYLDLAASNGLLDQSDVVSFHYYGEPGDLQERIGEYRAWLQKCGDAGMPLWITEIGPPWDGQPGRRADVAQDIERGLQFARDAVEARACGIARIFPFVLVDYSEHGTRHFGMLDAAGSPLRVIGDYAETIRELAGSTYIGDLKFAPGSRVFQRNAEDAVVVLTGREVPASWPFPLGEMHGIDGRVVMTPDPADGLTYLSVRLRDVEAFLQRNTPAAALHTAAAATNPRLTKPSAIVLMPVVQDAAIQSTPRGYQLAEGSKSVPIKLRVFNLGRQEAAALKLTFSASSSEATGATSLLETKTLSVAPGGNADANVDIPIDRLQPDRAGMCRVGVNAGAGIEPVAMNFILQRGLQEQLADHGYQFALPIAELNRWKDNTAGKGAFSRLDAGGWAYDATFNGGDRWAFPWFTLPQEVDPDRVSAVLVRARCLAPATVRIMVANQAGKHSVTAFSIIRADGQWHVALVPLDSFMQPQGAEKLGRQINDISIGLNSETDTNRLEVSDLYLLGG